MGQQSDFVGFLPKIFLTDQARVIGNETLGEFLQLPAASKEIPSLDDICMVANHFIQFALKPTGEVYTFDDSIPGLYRLQTQAGIVDYVLRARPPHEKKGETTSFVILQETNECTHRGILRTYLQEISPPQSK